MTDTTPPVTRDALLDKLAALGIEQTTHDHAPVFTVAQSADIKANLPGGHTKNLFLKDKSGAFFLICALGDTVIPINKLHPVLGCKRLSFGKAEDLFYHLGVTPGSVTFFSVINDRAQAVQLVLDKALFDHALVNFHPMKNDATTAVAPSALLTFAKATGHTPVILDFTTLHGDG